MNLELITHSAIRIISNDGKVIYFDPFKLNDFYLNDANIIFVTHSHYDHFSPEDIKIIKNKDTKIVITEDLFEKAIQCGFNESNILKVLPNNEYIIDGISFRTISAYNTNKDFHKKEYNWVGYIIRIDDSVIYVAGDTDITDEALSIKCDIAFVPVGGTYTMTAEEAANLVKQIKPNQFAVPTHYQTIVGSTEDAERFKSLLENNVDVKILM